MTAQQRPEQTGAGLFPWGARATFSPGKTRRQRQEQWQQQTTILVAVLAVSIIASAVFIVANWRQIGGAKAVSCAAFPQFCLPHAGGSTTLPALEAAGVRQLDGQSSGAPGVVRGVDVNGIPTLGDPSAPVHFVTVSDYACPHCQNYHETDVPRFIEDYVLTGQATFGIALATGTGQFYSETASQAALCAGEQGAFWEMSEEMFRLARTRQLASAFSLDQIRDSAREMGLDAQKLVECVASNRYAQSLRQFRVFAGDHGVSATPTVLVSYGDSNVWTIVRRDYESLKQLTEAAHRQ
ncbi:MAG: thioredoxin domain-containing protein [Anaerolineae bacterium]|nr:thioredoxin domain-containing protein [Anaerolineae bacterium]